MLYVTITIGRKEQKKMVKMNLERVLKSKGIRNFRIPFQLNQFDVGSVIFSLEAIDCCFSLCLTV